MLTSRINLFLKFWLELWIYYKQSFCLSQEHFRFKKQKLISLSLSLSLSLCLSLSLSHTHTHTHTHTHRGKVEGELEIHRHLIESKGKWIEMPQGHLRCYRQEATGTCHQISQDFSVKCLISSTFCQQTGFLFSIISSGNVYCNKIHICTFSQV